MNSRRKSLSQNLFNLYGEDGKSHSKRYQKLLCKKNVLHNQLLFLRRCRDNEIVPKGLMPTTGLRSSKAKRIMLQAGLSLVRATINDNRIKLQETKAGISKTYKWLKDNLSEEDFEKVTRVAHIAAQKTYSRVKQEHFPHHTVRNISSKELTDAENSILSKGMNFSPTPTSIPMKELIAATEHGIKDLCEGEATLVRSDVLRVLKKSKVPQPNITREEKEALNSLKTDDSIIVLPADKGRSTVVMDKDQYTEKMNELLSKGDTYKVIKKDPTQSLERKIGKNIKDLKDQNKIDKKTASHLTPKHSVAPRIYGLPKVHKENMPLRPIVSSINSPCYNLAKHLTDILTPLSGNGSSYIKNSQHFVERAKRIQIQPDDLLVSFDVVSLFTNVPIDDACKIIGDSLRDDDTLQYRTRMTSDEIVELTKLCLTSTYFKWQGKYYEQQEGQSMGSPLSPVTSNIFMEHFETKALDTYPLKPEAWFRYVDDTFVVWRHGRDELVNFLHHLNSQHESIQFTMEIEEAGCIPFLDVKVQRSDASLSFSIYRKPTHTDQYLHFTSSHHMSAKNSVVNTLVYRALTLCDEEYRQDELKHIEKALNNNGYPSNLVQKAVKKQTGKQSEDQEIELEERHKGVTFMPYVRGVSDKICRLLNRAGVKTFYSRSAKLRDILSHPKDPLPKDHAPCVYSIPCSCGEQYIGQTKRPLKVRLSEHRSATNKGKKDHSALAEHACNEGHQPLWSETARLAQVSNLGMRLAREALEIRLSETSSINRNDGKQISGMWKSLFSNNDSHPSQQ